MPKHCKSTTILRKLFCIKNTFVFHAGNLFSLEREFCYLSLLLLDNCASLISPKNDVLKFVEYTPVIVLEVQCVL